MARRFQPELILLDYRMDGTMLDNADGTSLKLIVRLKAEKETKQIPVIVLTNEDLSTEAEKWIKDLGADDYIHKGTTTEELVRRINEVLKR